MRRTLWHSVSGQVQHITVGDLHDGARPYGSRWHVVYSDPPWSERGEKWWRTHGRTSESPGYEAFLDAFCAVAASGNPRHILVEQSASMEDIAVFRAATVRCATWRPHYQRIYGVQYGGLHRPNTLLHYGPEPLTTNPTGMGGEGVTRTALTGVGTLDGLTICDPCMGLGMSSRMAHAFGADFTGLELDPRRAQRAIDWLTRHGYAEQ